MAGTPDPDPNPSPAGSRRVWHEHWAIKVLVWAIPIVFSSGLALASLQVLAADVDRLESVEADKRLSIIEERVARLEELSRVVSATNDNVIRLCQAQGVACK